METRGKDTTTPATDSTTRTVTTRKVTTRKVTKQKVTTQWLGMAAVLAAILMNLL